MRKWLPVLYALSIFVTLAMPVHASEPVLVRLSADRVEFYYDRFMIEADGHVRVQASNGLVATGDAFSMDLKLNRYVLAGHVTVTTASGSASGAAISDFLDFDRIYFIPVTSEPDRWTFLGGDLAHPVKGRIMPGDVFAFPQLPNQPSLTASGAVIGTKTYARFLGAQADFGGAAIPLGSYVVNFSPNQYFAQNSLSGANFDATWNFAGNTNTLSALHLRYDTQNYAFLAFEQHVVGDHEYAIVSVNPLSRAGKFYNLQLYDRLSDRLQLQSFSQVYAYQYNLSAPQAATQTTYLQGTYAFPHSYLSATGYVTNYNMLGINPLIQQTLFADSVKVGAGSLSHPSSLQINLASFQNRIGDSPFYEQIYGGYGFNHDTVGPDQYLQGCTAASCGIRGYGLPVTVPGLQAFGKPCNYAYNSKSNPAYFCPVYTTIWNEIAGFNFYASSIKFGDQNNPYKTYYFNASFNDQEQWNSLPHRVRQQITSFSVSRQFARQVNSYLSYSIQNTGDYYLTGGYTTCDPVIPPTNVPNPNCPNGLNGFRGAATWHTLALGINYVPSPEFNFSVLARHHADFPPPAPNFYAQPPTNVLGQPIYTTYLGQPPNDLTGDVRFKLLPHMLIDVARTYYFHYGSLNWSPQTIVQVLPI